MINAMLYAVNIRFAHLGRRPYALYIYECDLFKIYFTQIVKTHDLYNWMRL